MKITIKHFDVQMDLGNNGITMDVRDPAGTFLGDIRIGRGAIEWCKGKTAAGNGVKKKWADLIAFFEAEE